MSNDRRAIVDSDSVLGPQIFSIEFDLVFLEKCDKFVFERSLGMMSLLIGDIFAYAVVWDALTVNPP